MNTLDIILLICFIPAVISGLHRGLVAQLIGLLTIIFGCRLSVMFQKPVTDWLVRLTDANPEMIRIISFILIFIAVAVLLGLVGKILEGLIKIILLGWVNRLLGVLVAAIISIIIFGIIGVAATSLNNTLHLFDPAFLKDSVLMNAFQNFTVAIMPYLKSLIL